MANKQKHVGTSLNTEQYIEFLKFCKRTNQTKFRVVQNAVIKYCKITATGKNLLRTNITEELEELLK